MRLTCFIEQNTEVNVKISGWMADYQGCGFYRVVMPLQEIRRQFGAEVTLSTNLFDPAFSTADVMRNATSNPYSAPRPANKLNERTKDADVVIAQRICLPGPTKLWQALSRKQARPRLVFEIDDDLLNIDPSNAKAYEFFGQPEIRENLIRNASVADLVVTSTFELARVMSRYNANVLPLPNCVPDRLLSRAAVRRPVASGDRIVIGWAGSPTHAMDWAAMEPGLRWILNQYPTTTELHVIGHPYGQDMGLGDRYRHTPWSDTVLDYYTKVDFDIGLAPLQPHVFNDSKSHIKALEMGAMGIPVVASDTGPYAGYVQDGLTGLLVSTAGGSQIEQWYEQIRYLLDNPEDRRAMGRAAREQAHRFRISQWAATYLKAYTQTVESPLGLLKSGWPA